MIKKLTSYLLLLLFMAGCSDEFSWDKGTVVNPDGSIDFILSVPDMTIVSRSDNEPSSAVSNIQMLVFSGTSAESTLKYNKSLSLSDGSLIYDSASDQYSVHLDLGASLIQAGELGVYFIANPPEDMDFTDADIDNLQLGEVQNRRAKILSASNEFVLSGKYVGSLAGLKSTTIPLYRNAVKVTVNAMKPDGSGGYQKDNEGYYILGDAIYPFEVYGCAASTSITAGADGTLGSARAIKEFPFEGDALPEYVNPTANSGSLPIVIVRAKYAQDGKDYYYALAMKTKETNKETKEEVITAINFEPNHWYQILIKEIKAPGSNSPEDAALNPIMSSEDEDSAVSWEIHDHSPKVYNMVSDGKHELGVSHEVVYHLAASDDSGYYFYVKVFEHGKSLTFNMLKDEYAITVEENEDWLEIGSPEDATSDAVDSSITGSEGSTVGGGVPITGDTDSNSTGVVLKYPLRFKSTNQLGTLEGKVRVSWKGLLREIPVSWIRNFNGRDLCDITMRMFDETNTKQFETSKYWDLMEGKSVSGVSFFGIDQEHRGEGCRGMVRYEGIHFPVMYGSPSAANAWRYEYDLDFSPLQADKFKWFITLHGDAALKNYVKVEVYNGNSTSANTAVDVESAKTHAANAQLKLLVKRVGKVSSSDYDYAIGTIRLHIVEPSTNEETTSYDLQMYHTGFFHKNTATSESNRKDSGEGKGDLTNWYYYEVVPVEGPSGTRYMLDRNLGAKTAEFYLSNQGSRVAGADNAPGGYYQVAEKLADYKGTKMKDGICPPGYDYPSQAAWDAVRNSKNFRYERLDAYYKPVYLSGNAGSITFPKMEYIDGAAFSGQSLAGYYWSSTSASGLEKDEIGRWLRALGFTGSATSFINGNVEEFSMPVRCINYMDESSLPTYETYINVAGATHVYLYTVENNEKVGMMGWPGQAVGNYNNMAGQNNWFQYIFQSKTVRPQDLYVVFNFLNSDGTIYTYAKNGKGYSLTPDSAEGWKVVNDPDENIKDSTPAMADWIGVPTQNNYYWQWQHNSAPSASVSNKLYCYNYKPGIRKPVPMYEMRILWPKYVSGNECKQIRIWNTVTSDWEYGYEDGYKEQQGHGWTNFNQDGYSYDNNGAYYYNPEIPEVNKNVPMLIFVKKDNNVYVTKNTYKLGEYGTANNNLLHLHDSDFKVYNGSTDVVKYYLTLGSSGEKEMTESGSNWTLSSLSGSGDLKIYRKTNGTTDLYVKLNGSSLNTTGTAMNTNTQTSSVNVGNISASGTYSFTYNPTANTLTITGGSSGGDSYTCRIYWYGNSTFYQWGPSGLPTGGTGNITSDVSGYSCYEFTLNATEMAKQYNYHYNNKGEQKDQGTMFEVFGNSTSSINCAYIDSDNTLHKKEKPTSDVTTHDLLKKWVEANPMTDTNKRRIFWDNSGKNWSTVKIYWWNSDTSSLDWGARPTMNSIQGGKYWYYDIPSDAKDFKFSDGGSNESDNHTPTSDRCNTNPDVWNN
ncbi:MAG: hypothetical protein K2H46_06935 [Muribaculaceae bacterium]|nr:hypothetical protein [Muribaculaceae bacterium]